MTERKERTRKMTFDEMYLAYQKAVDNGDIHEARYYRNLADALYFDEFGRNYRPSEFGGWNYGKS